MQYKLVMEKKYYNDDDTHVYLIARDDGVSYIIRRRMHYSVRDSRAQYGSKMVDVAIRAMCDHDDPAYTGDMRADLSRCMGDNNRGMMTMLCDIYDAPVTIMYDRDVPTNPDGIMSLRNAAGDTVVSIAYHQRNHNHDIIDTYDIFAIVAPRNDDDIVYLQNPQGGGKVIPADDYLKKIESLKN